MRNSRAATDAVGTGGARRRAFGNRRMLAFLIAAVVAVLLGACGGEDSPAGQNGSASDRSVIPDLVSKDNLPPAPDDEVNVAVAPEMPPPIERSEPAFVDVEFEVVENLSTIDPDKGTEHQTWGYRIVDGPDTTVVGTPGPVIRTRVGDMLRFTITNPEGNQQPHNVDFHAVTGQGGGAEDTTVLPGETRTIEARMLYPGFFMYHCAYGDVPAHIAHGMSGGILVDPAEPLPEVDHEWYMVQSEYYVAGDGGLDRNAVTDENPTHVVFNGAVGALAGDNALQMDVGETARIYFVNAGLNLISSFHPIGSHWDAVYPEAALLNDPIRGSQTTLVPAGGGTVVELIGQVPQTVVLVDHALARAFDKGAIGQIVISGEEDPEIFREVEPRSGAGSSNGQEPPSEPSPSEPSPEPEADHTVAILEGSGDFQDPDAPDQFDEAEDPADYSTNVLEVQVGDTVTWTNEDAMAHTVTDEGGEFDSGFLNTGESFTHTFDEPGEYEYFCTPHPWMRARVIVSG